MTKLKVTKDPEATRNPISEPSGPVANDSLAAESATHGGAFSQNRGAEPTGASGSNYVGGGGGSGQSQYNGGAAPSYVADLKGDVGGHGKPKGKNLQEGGFDSDPKYNASFNAEIGSKDDPGRFGENDMQRRVADSGPDAGGGPRQKGVDNQHLFQNLAEQSA